MEIVKEAYQLCAQLPDRERYGLVSQLTRAAVSVPSNIAEGCSRSSDKEYKRFLEIAMGSLFEMETQLIIAQELGFISQAELEKIMMKITQCQKQTNALINKIKHSITKTQ